MRECVSDMISGAGLLLVILSSMSYLIVGPLFPDLFLQRGKPVFADPGIYCIVGAIFIGIFISIVGEAMGKREK